MAPQFYDRLVALKKSGKAFGKELQVHSMLLRCYAYKDAKYSQKHLTKDYYNRLEPDAKKYRSRLGPTQLLPPRTCRVCGHVGHLGNECPNIDRVIEREDAQHSSEETEEADFDEDLFLKVMLRSNQS